MSKLRFLDLFAGCGGLSLGLEAAGLELLTSVERSPMAAETHFKNFHRSDDPNKWEDHRNKDIADQAKERCIVAGVEEVLNDDTTMSWLAGEGVDVLVGGPPCQGFSMAGRRDSTDRRNQLPEYFLEFIRKLQPKAVVVENVVGINRRFVESERRQEDPDFRVRMATDFEELCNQIASIEIKTTDRGKVGYDVQPLELDAAHYGVPQHRPRMFIVAFMEDAAGLEAGGDPRPLWRSRDFFDKRQDSPAERVPRLAPRPSHFKPVSAGDALCDFEAGTYKFQGEKPSKRKYEKEFSCYAWEMRNDKGRWQKIPDSHEHRRHNPNTEKRFHLYRRLADLGIPSRVFALAASKLRGGARVHAVENFLRVEGRDLCEEDVRGLAREIAYLPTLKHSQQVLDPAKPSPTVVTIPDDFVHPYEDRVMTVRELARLQSFPDWFEFRGKMTTGGTQRKTEVPRYTQVGNAVPPLLAKAIGRVLEGLLKDH